MSIPMARKTVVYLLICLAAFASGAYVYAWKIDNLQSREIKMETSINANDIKRLEDRVDKHIENTSDSLSSIEKDVAVIKVGTEFMKEIIGRLESAN